MNAKTLSIYALSLLLLSISCQKDSGKEYEFTVFGKIPPGILSPSRNVLVFSDAEGNILESFEIAQNELDFQRSTKVPGDIGSIQVHLGLRYETNPTQIYSHLDVQNGELIAFKSSSFRVDGTFSEQKCVRVHGIQSLDSLGFLGNTIYTAKEPWEDVASTCVFVYPNEGAVLNIKANGEPNFRSLYLPDSILRNAQSFLDLDWGLLKPAPPKKHLSIEAGLGTPRHLQIDAVTDDFTGFVNLGPETHIDPLNLQFIQPDEVPKNLHVRLTGDNFVAERMFQDGDLLHIDRPDLEIGEISSTPGKGFKVATQGDIDLLELECTESTYYKWVIQGHPSSFKEVTMPSLANLSKHISLPDAYPTPFWRFMVRAHQFGKHDYLTVKEGAPYRSGGMFGAAQSGYFMLERWFE
jgi:hypothetical protein